MAYSRPPYDSRPPVNTEHQRSSWDTLQRPYYPPLASPSRAPLASLTLFDPESESSDVSDNPGEDYQTRAHSTYPSPIPAPPPKHTLESFDAIQARLRELQQVEDLNIKRQDQLKAKRVRKDEKIRHKREAQDAKIRAIIDARARRDDRIGRRRKMEDDAFERFDQDLEEEETNLRRRLKRLKRGLPVDDVSADSRIPSASMSPPVSTYSSIPPPAKRHQTGPPGQSNSPPTSTPRMVPLGVPSAPGSAGPNPPPYAFLQSSQPPAPALYGRSPPVSNSPSNATSAFQQTSRSSQPSSEPGSYGVNGHAASPQIARPSVPPLGAALNTAPPPRQSPSSSSYDTRPPPPMSSGFAPINPPSASGFAAINPRNTATPPTTMRDIPITKAMDHDYNHTHAKPHSLDGAPSNGPTTTGGKRTPSTTHPYQMSEAFANRHHHCERVDHLNRGIWTSYGPGGTKEAPTGPPQEMYLRCNHDGCRRIDWRTVHGLQCHIVKNHEQPRGTIGSLEKALDRYGVPVAEIGAYEREHGDASGGTMADPKNLKLKAKSRESTEKVDSQRKSYGTPLSTNDYRANLAKSLGNSVQPYQGSPVPMRGLVNAENEDSDYETKRTPVHLAPRPDDSTSKFPALNGAWSTVPGPRPTEPRDREMKDASASHNPIPSADVPIRDQSLRENWSRKMENGEERAVSNPHISELMPTTNHNTDINTPSQSRPVFVPLVPAPVTPTTPSYMSAPPQGPDSAATRVEERKDDRAPETPPTQAIKRDEDKGDAAGPTLEGRAMGASGQDNASIQENAAEATGESRPNSDKSKLEVKSPETRTRKMSIVGSRRIGSRRSSVAVSKAEKEREKEKEEAAATAAVEVPIENEPQDQAQDQDHSATKTNNNILDHQATETNGDQEAEKDEDDDDDGDTITAAVTSTTKEKDNVREKDKDKEKESREIKTTPRRLAKTRLMRKNR